MSSNRHHGLLRFFSRFVPEGERDEWLREWVGEIHRVGSARGELGLMGSLRVHVAAGEDALRLGARSAFSGSLWQDLRYAFRSLRSNPGYAGVALLTLAVGIGANTAIFTVVDAYLLRPLPLHEPDRLVMLERVKEGRIGRATSAPNYLDWRDQSSSFVDLMGIRRWPVTLTGTATPRRASRAMVTPGFFSLIGVTPALGRGFLPHEAERGNHEVVILSHDVWASSFGSDPDILGKTVTLDGINHEVVGIAPPTLRIPPFTSEIYVPLAFEEDALAGRGRNNVFVLGRLADGASMESARAELDVIAAGLAEAYPRSNEGWGVGLRDLRSFAVGSSPRGLWMILASVGFVLLIACVNVANLTIARGMVRSRELAVRVALGASRWRLLRQLLSESVLLALAGGVLGVTLAYAALDPIASLVPGTLSRMGELNIDRRVLGFVLGVSVLTGILSGLAPGIRISRTASRGNALGGVADQLRTRGSGLHVRGILVVSEFALAMILLVGAGLFMRTLSNLYSVDLGLDHEGVTTFGVTLPVADYPEPEDVIRGVERILEAVSAQAGVEVAAATSHLPLAQGNLNSSVILEEGPQEHGTNSPSAAIKVVTPGYFQAMGIELLSGRYLSAADEAHTEPVVMINRTAAGLYWPGEEAVGKWLSYTDDEAEQPLRRRVVGVIGDIHALGPDQPANAEVYQNHLQTTEVWSWFGRAMSYTVRTRAGRTLERPAVEAILADVDPKLPVMGLRTLTDALDGTVAAPRFQGILVGLFAGVALLLAVVGTYGVMAFSVRQRTREIGVRVALGAGQGAVLRGVLMTAVRLAAVGTIVGAAGAALMSRSVGSLLWGVEGTDPFTYVSVAAVLALATVIATLIPAVRASRVDPMVALRAE